MSSPSPKDQSMSPALKFFLYPILPLCLVIAGGVLLYLGGKNLHRANESLEWPSVEGSITDSQVYAHRTSGEKNTNYSADISYQYSVSGVDYAGSRVAYGDYGSSDSSHAEEIVDRYPKGDQVSVYYLPENPEESLLEPGIKGQSFILPVAGLVFLIVGFVLGRSFSNNNNDSGADSSTAG